MRSQRRTGQGARTCRQHMAVLLLFVSAIALTLCAGDPAFAAEGDLVWAKQVSGPGDAQAYAVATLSDGSSLVTGSFGGTVTFGPGEASETSMISEGVDVFVAKYDMNGRLVWVKRSDGGGYGGGIATLADGRAVVAGHLTDAAVTFGPGEPNETTLVGTHGNTFVAKFNPDGTLAWAVRIAASSVPHYSPPREIALLPDDSAVVTGIYYGEVTFGPGEPNETTLSPFSSPYDTGSLSRNDIFVAKYNHDGSFIWAKGAGGVYDDEPFGIAPVADGGVVVTGYFQRTATFGRGESNETSLTAGTHSGGDVFVAKYTRDGDLVWVKQVQAHVASCRGRNVASLSDGGVLVVGRCMGSSATFGPGEPNETTLVSEGVPWEHFLFLARYNADGTLAWAKKPGGDYWCDIAALEDSGALMTGSFYWEATFGSGEPNETTLISAGFQDMFPARRNPDGTLAWVKRAGGVRNDWGADVGTLVDGSAVVVGNFYYDATFGPGELNETTLISEGNGYMFLARFAGPRGSDLDGDGLADAVETDTGTYKDPTDTGTDPLNPDTDGDGLKDGDEVRDLDPEAPGVQNPFHPLDPNSTGDNFQDTPDGVPDGENDYDGDGQSNAYELEHGSNPLDAASIVPAVTYVGAVALFALMLLVVLIRLPYARRLSAYQDGRC